MEQKKILWIVTASGIFLAVVFLFALIICKPSSSNIPVVASIAPIERPKISQENSTEIAPVEISKTDIESLEVLEEPQEEYNPITKNEDGTITIDFNQISITENVSSVTPKNQTTAVAMENKKQVNSSDTIYTGIPAKKTSAELEAEKQASYLNATDTKKSKTVTNYSSSKTSSSASSNMESEKSIYVETTKYWIQCAAYTSKKTADNARSKLDENRIPAEVFTYKDSKNNLFYRVRVGPYTTKSEAEYWKNRISQLDDFKATQSYITMN